MSWFLPSSDRAQPGIAQNSSCSTYGKNINGEPGGGFDIPASALGPRLAEYNFLHGYTIHLLAENNTS